LDVLVSNTPGKPLDSELHFFMNSSVKDPRTIKCVKLIWDAGGRGAVFQRTLQATADLGNQEARRLLRILNWSDSIESNDFSILKGLEHIPYSGIKGQFPFQDRFDFKMRSQR